MLLVTVGTGTVVPDPERASSCHWIESRDTRILVDCGAGGLQGVARAGLAWGDLDHLVISHFHADHIGEIPSLVFGLKYGLEPARTKPLHIWGPRGTKKLFKAWSAALGGWLVDPGFALRLGEIAAGELVRIGDVWMNAAETPHTDESLALRFEVDDAVLGYTGDTGPSDDLAEFFRGVDLLLAECSLPDDLVSDNHLSPSSLARLASTAAVGRLAVTHVYPQLRALDVPGLIREAGYRGEIVMASDGLELTVGEARD
jgi:ribonuclease BN (tRNA processing enzyme)